MQHNATETGGTPTTKSPENNKQQSTTNSAAAFPTRASYNPRFAVTPETMGMNLRSDTPTPTREQTQHEPPLVDVKSYYERHNKGPTVGLLSDYKQESNNSFHSSHSNTPSNSYASIRTENVGQRISSCYPIKTPSPNVSPRTPSQQWSFDRTIKPEYLEQQNNVYTSSASLCPTQSAQAKYTASNNYQTLRSPDAHAYAYVQNVTSSSEIPTSPYNEEHHQKYRSGSDVCAGDSAKLNYNQLNELYAKRIEDIDANVWGDKDLKIVTYQEWVEMLTKISESFIINMDQLEREVADHLELIQRKVNSNCRHSQGNELMKCRKDIDTLLKYIKNARNYNSWDLQGLTFETITPAQVLDVSDFENLTIEGNGGDAMKNNNEAELYASMKALAHEVAEKHDEVRELKRQVISMEDEIQKAQQKIQLKDDVIKELRNDLKCANNKFSAQHSVDTGLIMPPINFEDHTSRSANTQLTDCSTPRFQDDNGSQYDSLSHTELEEQQKFKLLEEEMNEFFEMNTVLNKQKMENQRKGLMDIFQKLKSEKAAVYRKLDFIRSQLIDLESDSAEGNNDCDSGFHSKSEHDQDAKLLEAVRKRLRKLNESNVELKKRMQKLELENSDLSNSLHSEKTFSQRNSETLKELADLLCRMKGKQFSYTNIYSSTSNERNPFCEAIEEMKQDFQERESQLFKAVTMRNKQVEELSKSLLKNEEDFNQERTLHMNETLKCQIAHLQRTLFERDQRIVQLASMLNNVSQIQSLEPHQAALEYVTSRNNFTAELEKKIEGLTEKLDRSTQQEHFLHRETRKLNEELNESKRKNGDLISQAHRLGNLLKSQESHRMELAAKYEALEQNYEDQAKKLRTANNQLCMLSERFQTMEKRQNEHNMERKLLSDEVLSLKENHACAMGRQKSLEEQLLKTEKELYNAHDVIKQQKSIMQRNEFAQNEAQQRLQETNNELKRKFSDLVQDYKKLQEEHDKQKEINTQQLKLLENFRKWKEQQLKAEQTTRENLKIYQNCIEDMLQDKQKLMHNFHDLYKDYSLLQNELDRFKVSSLNLSNFSRLHNTSERSIAERLEIVRRTARRVSEQSSSFKDEEPTASRGDSSSAFRPSEEPL
ncbi:polyamine-modulated factor 1-binding protein 1 isoform X2 [Calliphora vicina]|uniref:polyamine-modulated factor 1-binding protein 1 isoform X2 n=1 Tax=Calliphora vicina TaxID=7373 RepID=UPI00325BE926